jgi:exodeoxyribonuclease VII small subunit
MTEKLSYEQAAAELEQILADLERGQIGIDVLAEKVERAGVLLRFCRDKLRDTEVKVNKIIEDLSEDSEEE